MRPGVRPPLGCGRPLMEPPRDHLPQGQFLVGPRPRLWVFGPGLAWWNLLYGPFSPLCLHKMILRFDSLLILRVFLMFSSNVLLEIINHQNSWNLVSYKS